MSGNLKLDTTALREAGSSLHAVALEFDRANVRSDAVADAVGHAGLASLVRDFAHGWDDTRADMVEGMAALADACTGIGEGFEDLDSEFAAALRGES